MGATDSEARRKSAAPGSVVNTNRVERAGSALLGGVVVLAASARQPGS